ncbi:MAG: PepSY domain-containing protein [Deltaproteobacteria bacterium]|nr:PepSY domain-containing protein [Deltaproteobacteria bacterium]
MIPARTLRILRPFALPAAALAVLGFTAPAAFADDDDQPIAPDEIQRIEDALAGKGYTDVHDIEVDDGRYEVDARNAEGQPVDLELDLKTLEILHEKRD